MNDYIFTVLSPKLSNSVVTYTYNLEGLLIRVGFNNDAHNSYKVVALSEAPVTITYIRGIVPVEFEAMIKVGCIVKDISEFDFSYESFAKLYGYRVGDLTKQRKLLNALSFEEKILAFAFIPRYKAYLNRTGIAQLYPERYLAQRRWENVIN